MNTKDFVKEEFPANKNNSTDKKERTHSRRKALKKIALGGTIAVGASTLPPQWTKPIVDKVIVPAHAETSPEPTTTLEQTTTTTTVEPTTTIECPDLMEIPGFTIACSDPTRDFWTRYAVVETNGCYEIIETGSEEDILVDGFIMEQTIDQVLHRWIQIRVLVGGQQLWNQVNCQTGQSYPPRDDTIIDVSFTAQIGETFVAAGTFTPDYQALTLSFSMNVWKA